MINGHAVVLLPVDDRGQLAQTLTVVGQRATLLRLNQVLADLGCDAGVLVLGMARYTGGITWIHEVLGLIGWSTLGTDESLEVQGTVLVGAMQHIVGCVLTHVDM